MFGSHTAWYVFLSSSKASRTVVYMNCFCCIFKPYHRQISAPNTFINSTNIHPSIVHRKPRRASLRILHIRHVTHQKCSRIHHLRRRHTYQCVVYLFSFPSYISNLTCPSLPRPRTRLLRRRRPRKPRSRLALRLRHNLRIVRVHRPAQPDPQPRHLRRLHIH